MALFNDPFVGEHRLFMCNPEHLGPLSPPSLSLPQGTMWWQTMAPVFVPAALTAMRWKKMVCASVRDVKDLVTKVGHMPGRRAQLLHGSESAALGLTTSSASHREEIWVNLSVSDIRSVLYIYWALFFKISSFPHILWKISDTQKCCKYWNNPYAAT